MRAGRREVSVFVGIVWVGGITSLYTIYAICIPDFFFFFFRIWVSPVQKKSCTEKKFVFFFVFFFLGNEHSIHNHFFFLKPTQVLLARDII